MKLNASQFTLTFVLLLALLSFSAVYAESANTKQSNTAISYQHKTPGEHYKNNTTPTELKKNNKKILIKESREMSPFFKLGIAINIIMVIVFGWWFRKEWRRKKKR